MFLILLICTMVSLVKGTFNTCLWWPLHLDNWYLSLCIGHRGGSHAVPVLLVKVIYSVYIIYIHVHVYIYIYIFSLFINNIIIDCTSLIYWQLLLKVYFTGNKTIYIQTNCTGDLYNYMTLSICPCCYYVHCMYVFHIGNHCNCYAPCGSLIGQ